MKNLKATLKSEKVTTRETQAVERTEENLGRRKARSRLSIFLKDNFF